MAIYRTGSFSVATVASDVTTLNLGFLPSVFRMYNFTLSKTSGSGIEAYWNGLASSVSGGQNETTLTVWSAGSATRTTLTTTGIVPFQTSDAALFVPNQAPYTTASGNRAYIGQSTLLVITGLSNAGNASVTATHSFTSADIGVTVVTFHGVVGMTEINGLRGVVKSVTSTTSFTVDIDSTNFGTYVAGTAGLTGGFANVITGAPANTLYGNKSLPTAQANLGLIGFTINTGVTNATGAVDGDVWIYEAILQSPATGP